MDVCETQVRERAYYIWEVEGYEDGRAETHWLRAEGELRAAADVAQSETVVAPVTKLAAKPRTSRAKAGPKAVSAAKPASKPRTKSVRSPASPDLSPL